MPSLPKGVYTVTWRTVSRDDGHVTAGSFSFGIGERPPPGAWASRPADHALPDGARGRRRGGRSTGGSRSCSARPSRGRLVRAGAARAGVAAARRLGGWRRSAWCGMVFAERSAVGVSLGDAALLRRRAPVPRPGSRRAHRRRHGAFAAARRSGRRSAVGRRRGGAMLVHALAGTPRRPTPCGSTWARSGCTCSEPACGSAAWCGCCSPSGDAPEDDRPRVAARFSRLADDRAGVRGGHGPDPGARRGRPVRGLGAPVHDELRRGRWS